MPVIPKKIHLIWVGGPLKEEDIPNLMKLTEAAKNSGFEINLWVDDESNLSKSKFFSHSTQQDQDRIPYLRLRNIKELREKMEKDEFYKQEDRLARIETIINREMIGFKNLAAVSDILRYEILRQEGGYYFDIDRPLILDSPLAPDNPNHGILFGMKFQYGFIGGNDLIAATPGHEFFEMIIKRVLKNYDDFNRLDDSLDLNKDQKDLPPVLPYHLKDKENYLSLMDKKRLLKDEYEHIPWAPVDRPGLTLLATGPAALVNTILEFRRTKEANGTKIEPREILFERDVIEIHEKKLPSDMKTLLFPNSDDKLQEQERSRYLPVFRIAKMKVLDGGYKDAGSWYKNTIKKSFDDHSLPKSNRLFGKKQLREERDEKNDRSNAPIRRK